MHENGCDLFVMMYDMICICVLCLKRDVKYCLHDAYRSLFLNTQSEQNMGHLDSSRMTYLTLFDCFLSVGTELINGYSTLFFLIVSILFSLHSVVFGH